MRTIVLFFSSLLLFGGCTDLQFPKEVTYPVIELKAVKDIGVSGATFEAFTHHIGNQPILRSSFNWYPVGKAFPLEEERFLLDVNLAEGEASTIRINRDLVKDAEYVLRMIIETAEEKIYTDTIHFTSQGATFSPIQTNSYSLSASFFFRGFNNDLLAGSATVVTINSTGTIYRYNPASNQWNVLKDSYSGNMIRNYFQTADNKIYAIAKENPFSSNSPFGIWTLDDYQGQFERISDFVYSSASAAKFSFVFDEQCFTTRQWTLIGFPLDNYQSIEQEVDIPFRTDAVVYHSTTIRDKGYVFFSEPTFSNNSITQNHQFWEFDSATLEWTLLADFPGSGKDKFSISSDNQRYIFIGMGTIDFDGFLSGNNKVAQGDIWRYDISTNSWEFIGWNPRSSSHVPLLQAKAKDGQHRLPTRNQDSGLVLVTITPNSIQPL
ncbi:MAG: hypothetical protein AAF798_03340 [Bacteroidota bacterium]